MWETTMSSRKLAILILALLVMSAEVVPAFGQAKPFTQIRFGTLNPKDAKSGVILGVRTGRDFDNMVLVGFSADLFWKSYTEESTIADSVTPGGVIYSTVQTSVDYKTLILPLMFTADVRIPVENAPIKPYIGGGIGYQLLFNKEDNFDLGISDSRFYHGFGYQLQVGAEYRMSPNAGFYLEAFYNGCKAKRSSSSTTGLPTFEEVDISGIGFRVGVTLTGWGI
jgi:opacity protein-like surface antigen